MHTRLVLQSLKEDGLQLRLINKCVFRLQEMENMGYSLSLKKNPFQQRKSRRLHIGQCLRRKRKFAVSCNSYFSDLVSPLTDFLRKSLPQEVTLTPAWLEAYDTLKLRLISAPCLICPKVSFDATFAVATNASTVGIAAISLYDQ
jgi:hypothetical protein